MNSQQNDDASAHELTEEDKALLGEEIEAAENKGDNDDAAATTDQTHAASTSDPTLVTREGLKKLKEELHELEEVKRAEVAARLKEAISYGDLSENSEYEDAKNEQAFVEGRIAELKEMIKNAKIITEKHGAQVRIGSTVTVENLTEKDGNHTYTIVGSTETDPQLNKISNESPVGMALIDKQKGDEVTVHTPGGQAVYKIVSVD